MYGSSYTVANVCVVLQLIVGELIFIYPYKKRKYFGLRFPLSVALCILLVIFYPTLTLSSVNLERAIRLVIYFSATIAVYFFCFDLQFKVTLSLCSAGYALQHIIYQFSTLFHNLPLGDGFTDFVTQYHRIVEMTIFVIGYILFFFTIGRKIAKQRVDKNFNNMLNFFAVFVVLVCIILSLLSGKSNIPVYVSLYSMLCCSMALIIQFAVLNITRLYHENEAIRRKTEADIARYESAKDAVDFINIKLHDLKKELNSLNDGIKTEETERLRNSIEIYDNVCRTGNDIIDTIMLNAVFHQMQYGVTFTFSGNGEWLDFVNAADLKSLFMNAVSNAADAAAKAEPDKRNVSIVLDKKGDMVLLTVRNYYVGDPVPTNSPLKTTKKDADSHGYGMKSMALTAEKYGGSVTFSGVEEIFTLTVALVDN